MDLEQQLALRYLADRGIVLPQVDSGWDQPLCRAYDSRESLIALVLPWFRKGLESDERCIWQLGRDLTIAAARRALDAMREFSADQVDLVAGGAEVDWLREEARALGQGYRGLRISGECLHAGAAFGRRTRRLCLDLVG